MLETRAKDAKQLRMRVEVRDPAAFGEQYQLKLPIQNYGAAQEYKLTGKIPGRE